VADLTLAVAATSVAVDRVIPGNDAIATMRKTLFLFLILLSVVMGAAAQQRAIPDLWGHRVHDEAHVLSQATIDRLEVILKEHEDSTTNQIAVLIIPSLEGEDLEGYSIRVAHDTWKLGQKNRDNGVLLLIALDDRKMRIEVGQGLEGVLTDAICSRIIRNEMAPHFREQQYEEGVTAAVQAIIKAIRNEYQADDDDDNLQSGLSWKERLFMGVFVFTILGIFTVLGVFVPGGSGWFLYAFLIPFYATFPMFILNTSGGLILLGLYLVCFPIARLIAGKTAWGKQMANKAKSSSRRNGGGWSGGSWSSGRSGGSSSSSFGGGFSGGGSFGGGGSSGSW
jgi:uncharacterized protein